MKFKFWGVRGSIPVPGPRTVKYGGNTSCIEVLTASNELLILDGGTGIFALAQSLQHRSPVTAHILLTHTHWDHIQGLPFFLPIFNRGNVVHLYGADDAISGVSIERALKVQLQHSFFPINQDQLTAEVSCHPLVSGQSVKIAGTNVTPVKLNHPVVNLGYRIDDSDGSSLFFTGDYEPLRNPHPFGSAEFLVMQQAIEDTRQEIGRLLADVDTLIVDASYTQAEYPSKLDWGHGTFEGGIDLARQVGAKRLYFSHHEPSRSDEALEGIFQALQANQPAGLQMFLAKEGEDYRQA